MKTENPKNLIKTFSFWNIGIIVAGMLTLMFPPMLQARQSPVTMRPLSEFLAAQGTSHQYFPPVQDYVGWTDQAFTTFALVDYAGLADKWIKSQTGHSLGTRMNGSVLQRELADGKAQITVTLSTSKALGFAQSIQAIVDNEGDFLNTPTIFGAKAQEVVEGTAKAAVGPVTLITTFTISYPGAPLPDLIDVINDPGTYGPVTLSVISTTTGKSPDGKAAVLYNHQVAYTDSTTDPPQLIFPVAVTKIIGPDGDK